MARSVVAVVKCDSYDPETAFSAVSRGVDLIGGAAQFARSGETVLLKPNILAGADPETAVATHPVIFEAVLRVLASTNASLCYGDSPAFHKTAQAVVKGGFAAVAERYGVPLADFETTVKVDHPAPLFLKTIPLAKGVLDADGVVSISKMKTHGLTRMTGAIKNQYGCIPGLTKGKYHTVAPMVGDFSAMLVDINTYIRPRLYVMDAVVAMEGNGPNSGDPKKIGCILLSTDPVALDATACRIIDLNPQFVPTNLAGEKGGLGTYKSSGIDIVGDGIEPFVDKSFNVTRSPALMVYGSGFARHITSKMTPRPVIDSSKCITCGRCIEICPVDGKAVDWTNVAKKAPPQYDYVKCIRCYCCQETCPAKAITIHTPMLGGLLPMLAWLKIIYGALRLIAKRMIRMAQGKW